MVTERVSERIRELPDRPGIYIFLGEGRRPLYVGKARSLRKRALTYLSGGHEPRLEVMLDEAREIDFLVTDSEAEALLLENNWIKKKRPRFNILLRDDKTYPYIRLSADPYPRVAFTRRILEDGADYFGPYLPAGLARKAIKLVQKLFQLRVCTLEIDGSLPRPCLYYDMRRCLGPCVAGLTSPAEYSEAVSEARLFLAGRTEELASRLRAEMRLAAEGLEFEKAARLRDLSQEVAVVSQRRKLSSLGGEDVDIFGVEVRGRTAAVVILVMRAGQVLDRREIFWEDRNAISAERLLSELLPQIYDRTTFIPKEIHLPRPVEGAEALCRWLSERKGERVYLRLPSRGPKAQRVDLASRNARLAHRRRFRGAEESPALQALRDHLELYDLPRRIEGFDISNFQGAESVASLVVCEEGRMRKSEYRTFNIRTVSGPDDIASVREAVARRYRRRLEELGEMPDLVLIDGGRGQLNAAMSALSALAVEETPLVALAKRQEELYLVGRPEPLRLPRTDPGLRLLQQIRDEAHRFAVSRHRRRRRRGALGSALDAVPGVGPMRRKLLLRSFGSLEEVRKASLEELQAVVGPILGDRLFRTLREPPENPRRRGELERSGDERG
jgi:excinuclease ABC subunit C